MGNSALDNTNLDTKKPIIFTKNPIYALRAISQIEGKAAGETVNRIHPIEPGQGIIFENRQGIKSYLIATAYDTPNNSCMLREARPDEIKKMNELMQTGPEKSIFDKIFSEKQKEENQVAAHTNNQPIVNPTALLQEINANMQPTKEIVKQA